MTFDPNRYSVRAAFADIVARHPELDRKVFLVQTGRNQPEDAVTAAAQRVSEAMLEICKPRIALGQMAPQTILQCAVSIHGAILENNSCFQGLVYPDTRELVTGAIILGYTGETSALALLSDLYGQKFYGIAADPVLGKADTWINWILQHEAGHALTQFHLCDTTDNELREIVMMETAGDVYSIGITARQGYPAPFPMVVSGLRSLAGFLDGDIAHFTSEALDRLAPAFPTAGGNGKNALANMPVAEHVRQALDLARSATPSATALSSLYSAFSSVSLPYEQHRNKATALQAIGQVGEFTGNPLALRAAERALRTAGPVLMLDDVDFGGVQDSLRRIARNPLARGASLASHWKNFRL